MSGLREDEDNRTEITCLECGIDWMSRGDEPEFPLCSPECLEHFLGTQSILHNRSFRAAIEMWASDNGNRLLESEVDDLCMRLQPYCELLKESRCSDG